MIRVCQKCKKEYETKPSAKIKYCTQKCYFDAKRDGEVEADKSCYKDPAWLKKQRESNLRFHELHPEARIEKRKRMMGANNHNWKGGITKERDRIYRSKEWKDWRRTVFIRDDWTCQKCGARSSSKQYVRIESHHIKPFSLFKELRFDINNGLTLCKACHSKEPKGWELKI